MTAVSLDKDVLCIPHLQLPSLAAASVLVAFHSSSYASLHIQTGYEPKLLIALETQLFQKNALGSAPKASNSRKFEVTADQITCYIASGASLALRLW